MEDQREVVVLSAVRTPIGKYGGGLAVKALYELRRTGGRYALTTMCIGRRAGHRSDLRTDLTRTE